MNIEFLVEEESAEAALRNLVPMIIGPHISFRIHPFQGKDDLIKKLPQRLRAYRKWLPADDLVVVLVDRDGQDCVALKSKLEGAAEFAGFVTRSRARPGTPYDVVNRIAVEELEAWFFGDPTAIRTAYPGTSIRLEQSARFRDPDAIKGGTAEALASVLRTAGHHRNGLEKIRAAREISTQIRPDENRSRSLQAFQRGLREAVATRESKVTSPDGCQDQTIL